MATKIPAIPLPSETTVQACLLAIKTAVEMLSGVRGDIVLPSTVTIGGSTTTSSSGLTQAQVLARISLGV